MNINLVYVHIGKILPESFLDNIYQTLLTNDNIKIYILIDDLLIDYLKNEIKLLNTDFLLKNEFNIEFIRNSLIVNNLQKNVFYLDYIKTLQKFNIGDFRDGFWISTTMRFFYIYSLMELFFLENIFHIENDVLLYKKLHFTKENQKPICKLVRDSINRIIPSIMFFEKISIIESLVQFITCTLYNSNTFINDMNLLHEWIIKEQDIFIIEYLNTIPSKDLSCWDGAAIGQFLDGVDIKNIGSFNDTETQLLKWTNPTKGFIN